MRLRRLWLVCAVLLVMPLATPAAATPRHPRPLPPVPPLPVYLALGDSVAAGVGASVPAHTGYVPQLQDRLRHDLDCWPLRLPGCRLLRLRNISVPGATTVDLIDDQLPRAVRILESRNGDRRPYNDVPAVTVTIGGNDVFGPTVEACVPDITPECARTVARQLGQVAANLPVILDALADAGGGDATVAIMTYYNPLAACVLAKQAPLADVVLEGGTLGEGGPELPVGLNDIIREAALQEGAVVAETFGALDVDDLVGGEDCLHPDDSGHAKVAGAFAGALVAP